MPTNFSQQERQRLLSALGNGRQSAITAKFLAQNLGYPTRSQQVRLRKLISECIEIDGDLIGATTGRPAGFFKISSLQELERYLDSLENRTREDNNRRTALINNWNSGSSSPHTQKQPLTVR